MENRPEKREGKEKMEGTIAVALDVAIFRPSIRMETGREGDVAEEEGGGA